MIRLSGSPLPAPMLFTAVVGTAALVGFYVAVHKTFVGQLVEHGHGTHVPSPLPRGIALNGGQVGPSTVTPVTAPVEGIDGLGAINLAVELLAIASLPRPIAAFVAGTQCRRAAPSGMRHMDVLGDRSLSNPGGD
jgi:hypothetical protein